MPAERKHGLGWCEIDSAGGSKARDRRPWIVDFPAKQDESMGSTGWLGAGGNDAGRDAA